MLFRVPSLEQHAKQHHQTVVLLCVSLSKNPGFQNELHPIC